MDGQICKELPEELLETVIARLPIEVFFRIRLVCRKWNSLLESPSFLRCCAEVSKPNKLCLFTKLYYTDSFYDLDMRKWYHLRSSEGSPIPHPTVASVEGLICQVDYLSEVCFVGNPITKTWKEFPWFFKPRQRPRRDDANVVAMLYTSSTKLNDSYKIVTLERDGDYKVIDSLRNCMPNPSPTTVRKVPSNITLPMFLGERTITLGTVIYFLRSSPGGILSYDVASDTWEQIQIVAPLNSEYLTLAECDGRILLAGYVRDYNEVSISIRVWELERTTLVWVEVDRMPKSWCSSFKTRRTDLFLKCLGNKRVLVMSMVTYRISRMFTYDVVSQVWSKIPGVTPREKIDAGIGFFPSLYASP